MRGDIERESLILPAEHMSTRIRWAEELTGRNSVNPCTIPNTTACQRFISLLTAELSRPNRADLTPARADKRSIAGWARLRRGRRYSVPRTSRDRGRGRRCVEGSPRPRRRAREDRESQAGRRMQLFLLDPKRRGERIETFLATRPASEL